MLVIVARKVSDTQYDLRIDQEHHVQKHRITLTGLPIINGWHTFNLITPFLEIKVGIKMGVMKINHLDFSKDDYYIFNFDQEGTWYQSEL